jgi:hypothetical protein
LEAACRKAQRSDRKDGEAVVVDQERAFVAAVTGTSILDDPQPPGRNLLRDPMIQNDDAIGDIFFQPMPGERSVAPFPGDNRRHALFLEPLEQPPQFGPQDGRVRQSGEQGFNRIQHDPLGPNRVDGVPQADEQAVEVILARFLDLAPLDADVIQRELLLTHQFVQVEA